MTDRRAGSVDVQVDITFNPDRRVGSVDFQVDYVPIIQRQIGAVGVMVDLDRRPQITLERQTASVGVNVDLDRRAQVIILERQTGALGVTVDVAPSTSNTFSLTVTATQATAVGLAGSIAQLIRAISQGQTASLAQRSVTTRTYGDLETFTYGALEAFTYGQLEIAGPGPQTYPLSVSTTQTAALSLGKSIARVLTLSQATAATVRRQTSHTLASVTVGQLISSSTSRVVARTVTATQAQVVALRKAIAIRRALTGSHRIQTRTSLLRQSGPKTRAVTQSTAVRLLKQVRLTRSTSNQAISASLSGLPVDLVLVSTVQTRSLGLGRVISLVRSVVQATAAQLAGGSERNLLVVQPTALSRQQAIDLSRTLRQAQAVSLEALYVTPRYEILVTASVSQQVALGMSDTGAPAKRFVVDTRQPDFIVDHRASQFVVPSRRGRFRVEVR